MQPVLRKKAKQVQPVLRRSLRLQAKEDTRKEEEAKKQSKQDDSVVADIETHSDSELLGESGETSQGILNSIGGLLSRISGAAANITESTSIISRRWSIECLMRLNLLHFKMVFQERDQRNGLKQFNLKFPF